MPPWRLGVGTRLDFSAERAGILTPSTKAELEAAERERNAAAAALTNTDDNWENIAGFLPAAGRGSPSWSLSFLE
jgi:hypothetical protein